MIFLLPKPPSTQDKQRDLELLITRSIQQWLAQLLQHALAEYAEKKDPRDRSLQNGYAWATFREKFPETGPALLHVCLGLYRYTRADCPLASILYNAAFALHVEEDCLVAPESDEGGFAAPTCPAEASCEGRKSDEGGFADLLASETPGPKSDDTTQAILLTCQTVERWCDWLDASIHLLTHSYWHNSPVCFDPDPEKRDLACLGVVQRSFAHQPSPVKALWHEVYFDAAERFKNSPKWLKVGQAMASEQQRPWPYREVDTAVISLWPLLNRHNWTYRDLMNVVRSALATPTCHAEASCEGRKSNEGGIPAPHSALCIPHSAFKYPCEREQDFTVHCRTVLGLRKTGRGKSSKDGRPPGHQIANELFRAALGAHTSLRPQT